MLHDQSVVAGIGNIYSDEILYLCGIYPEAKCMELTDGDWKSWAEQSRRNCPSQSKKIKCPLRISGGQGQGIPQYVVSESLWAWGCAVFDLRQHFWKDRRGREKQMLLSGVPEAAFVIANSAFSIWHHKRTATRLPKLEWLFLMRSINDPAALPTT